MGSTQGPSGTNPTTPVPYSSKEDRGPPLNKDQKPFSIHSKKQSKQHPEEPVKEKTDSEEEEKLLAESEEKPPSIFSLSKPPPKTPSNKGEELLMPPPEKDKPIVKHEKTPLPKKEVKAETGKEAKSPFDISFHRKTKDEGTKDQGQGGQNPDPNLQLTPQILDAGAPASAPISGSSGDVPPVIADFRDFVNTISSIYVRESHIDGHQTTVNLKDGTTINVQNIAGTLAITISTADYRVQKIIADNIANIREALGLKNIKVSEINIETSSMDDKERDEWSDDQSDQQDQPGKEGPPR